MDKKAKILAAVAAILAVAAALGVRTFIGPCVHEDGAFGPCHFAGQVVLGISVLIAAEGAAAALIKSGGTRRGLMMAMSASSVLAMLTPGILIGLCKMDTMRCRAVMRPSVMAIFALTCVISLFGAAMARD